MRNKIHIKGWANEIKLTDTLNDNYDLGASFDYEEESEDVLEDIIFKMYSSDKECSLEEAEHGHLEQMLGALTLTGQEYGYSEFTTEGFNVHSATMGGHNLQKIIDSKAGKFLHITLEQDK